MMEKYYVINRPDEKSNKIKEDIIKKLDGMYELNEETPDYCFAIGGDGTLLYAIHKYMASLDKVKFIGIHTGTLGFFSDYKMDEVDTCLSDFINKKPTISSHPVLQAKLSDGTIVNAVNEIRVEDIVRAQLLDIDINEEYFESFRGNGILVCTQLGSTAYNRSIKGAIIDSGLSCIEMSEIAGLNHGQYRSLGSSIMFKEDTVIRLNNKHFKGVSLLYDQFDLKLENQEWVEIRQCTKKVQILRYRDIPYLKRIKTLF